MSKNRKPETVLAQVIHDYIDSLPHARRLYPDIYCNELAETVLEQLLTAPVAIEEEEKKK